MASTSALDEDGWIRALPPALPWVVGAGPLGDDARKNVIDAPVTLLFIEPETEPPATSDFGSACQVGRPRDDVLGRDR